PGRGYRFVAEVALHDGRPAPAAAALAPRPAERPHRPGAGLVLGAGLALALLLAWPRLRSAAGAPPAPVDGPAAAPVQRTLAVLPLQVEDGAGAEPWLAAGLAEGLGLRLAGVPGLHVFPAPSSRRLTGLEPAPLQAARGPGPGLRSHRPGPAARRRAGGGAAPAGGGRWPPAVDRALRGGAGGTLRAA